MVVLPVTPRVPPTVALVPIATVPAVIVVVPVPLLIVIALFSVEAISTPAAPVSVKAPALVVRFEAAPASILTPRLESMVNAPVVSISTPLVPASILIPPADVFAISLIASACDSVEVIFTDEPVAVMFISSPAAAPVALISIPPELAVRTTADAPSFEDAMFTCPVESISRPLVPASILIPPADVLATIVMALASDSVDVMLTEDPVAVISMSSPAPAPDAVISIPPLVEFMTIESATFSVDVILTEEPVAVMSISSPALAPDAEISIPPPVAIICNASAAVPAELNIRLAFTSPVCDIVRSCPSPLEACVMVAAAFDLIVVVEPFRVELPVIVRLLGRVI